MKPMRFPLLLILLPLLFACSDPEPIRIGFVAGLSGRVADLGIAGRNGVLLASEEVNQSGGINGRRIELLMRDDQQNPDTAQAVVNELLAAKVVAIIGHMTSSMSASTVPLMNAAKIVMLSPTTTSTQLSGKDDYFLRIAAATDLYTNVVAKYLAESGFRTVVAIYDKRNLAYTGSWLKDFTGNFEKQGGSVKEKFAFTSGVDIHFSKLAEQVVQSKPDAVLSIANALDTAMFAQQLRKIGSQLPLATCEWAATEKLINLGGTAVEGIILDQFFDRDSQIPSYLTFSAAYRKRFAEEPGFASVAGYDAANTLFSALQQTSDPKRLKQTLLEVGTFPGVQGNVHLDAFGDADRPTFLVKVEDGKFKRIK